MGAKGERQQSRRQRQAEKEFMDDQIYHERLMVLDAAEEGFFQRVARGYLSTGLKSLIRMDTMNLMMIVITRNLWSDDHFCWHRIRLRSRKEN